MAQPFTDDTHPAEPYPGTRPEHCFVHLDETGWPVTPDLGMASGWRVEPENVDLDQWLADRGELPLAARMPVLGYGSNANPSKVTWLRDELGLTGPAVVLRAQCEGIAAVWAAGKRARDGQRPATLAGAPSHREEHSVWFATPEQLRVLDRCEGRGLRYRLVRLHTGRITLQNGGVIDSVLAYTAGSKTRMPVLFNGRMVRCSEMSQEHTGHLGERPTATDGLQVTEVHGDPSADDWPELLFVYGTLKPGASAWRLMEPHVVGDAEEVRLPGTLHDTGLGYPALRPGAGPGVPGVVLRLRSPEDALPLLDSYEGDDYRRVRVVLPGGRVAWTYLWTAEAGDMPVLANGWVHDPVKFSQDD